MKLAVFSDIHGNEESLRKCLKFIANSEVDYMYFLGDAIGYMPNGSEVIDLLYQLNIKCLMGNHEAMALGLLDLDPKKNKVYNLKREVAKLNKGQLELIASWPQRHEEELDGLKFLMVHGSLTNHLTGYVYPDSDLEEFGLVDADVILMGHTHRPFIKKLENKIVVNVGSIGLPRDIGNLSSICIIETDPLKVDILRIHFDTDKVLESSQDEIHDSVVQCFGRHKEHFVGTLVNFENS